MLQSKKQAIRTLLIVGYSEVLTKVRRREKGLRIAYLFSIQIIGEHSGLRLVDYCKLTGRVRSNAFESIERTIIAGFVVKRDKRYYLTDKGQTVYNTVCREFNSSMKEIIRVLVEEARRQI